jgi:hypothetical protein
VDQEQCSGPERSRGHQEPLPRAHGHRRKCVCLVSQPDCGCDPRDETPTELLELLGKEVLRLIDYSSLRLLELVFESNRSLRFVIVDKKTWDVWYHGLAFLCGEVCSKTLNTHSYAALASSMLIYICMQMCIHFPFIVSLAEGLVSLDSGCSEGGCRDDVGVSPKEAGHVHSYA